MQPSLPTARGRLWFLVASVLVVAAIAGHLHNAWSAPVLAGYDAFGHFTYIWYVAKTGDFPLPDRGWSFFHPPLYYAFCAAIWDTLSSLDPLVRLKVAKVLLAAAGLVQAAVAWQVTGKAFPGNRRVQWMASLVVLAVPVQLYSTGFLGNEGVHAIAGALSILALLRVLERPTAARAAVLGVLLGAAMLAKYSALALVAASLATLALRAALAVSRRDGGPWLGVLALTSAVALAVCGPWYLRNVEVYGTPFQLSRDTLEVSYVESNQPQAARGWADYLTFDPWIFRRPAWPRGSSASEDAAPHGFARSVRESVFTGLYANAWFDGFGGWVLPPVTGSEASRRAGQLLLTLGLIPTAIMLLGAGSAVFGLRRRGWDDRVVALALASTAMLALLVHGTIQVPIAAAVKATYFMPVSVAFAFWLAHGIVWLDRRLPRASRGAEAAGAVLAALSLAVFWQGFVFDAHAIRSTIPWHEEGRTNQLGIVSYAGGRTGDARRAFEQAAATNYHLAIENLAFLAIDDGRPEEGAKLLRRAAHLQRKQIGGTVGRKRFLNLSKAEYEHSIAVVLHGLGRSRRATVLWQRALHRDPGHGEALWSLTLSRLENAMAAGEGEDSAGARRVALDDASRGFTAVRELDPGLDDGWRYGAAVLAARGDCDGARRLLASWSGRSWTVQRRFPAQTGTGAGISASIGRRRLIRPNLERFDPGAALGACAIAIHAAT